MTFWSLYLFTSDTVTWHYIFFVIHVISLFLRQSIKFNFYLTQTPFKCNNLNLDQINHDLTRNIAKTLEYANIDIKQPLLLIAVIDGLVMGMVDTCLVFNQRENLPNLFNQFNDSSSVKKQNSDNIRHYKCYDINL